MTTHSVPTNASPESAPTLLNQEELQARALELLRLAKHAGASQAEVQLHTNAGFSVTVRKGEVDTLEHDRGKGLSISVYFGNHLGSASTSDLHPKALQITLEKACHIARFTGSDPYMSLADAELMAYNYPSLDLYHPWDITPEAAIHLARECEQIARAVDKRITNCDGASVNTRKSWHLYANSHGFVGQFPTTYHSTQCALIAQAGQDMHSDQDYSCDRDPKQLDNIALVAQNSAQKVLQRLGARPISTRECPVIFKSAAARSLIGHFLAAISGGNLYRKSSFLLDQLGQQIFPASIRIQENPHLPKSLGAAPFDSEGVRTQARFLVEGGILQGYLLGSYSARKLNMQSTGNAGGAHNIFVQSDDLDLHALLKAMGTGLLVTDLMGQGTNIVTGDYSRGAFGFWVENGEIQHPVNEITVAGNLKDMFARINAVGNDVDMRGSIQTGSIWIDSMKIAGK